MSSFTYISFPREVDTTCIVSKFDKSKAFTVKEIRGTEWESKFDGDLNELPDDAHVYFGDWFSDFQGISVYDKREATFDGVFDNPFIYGFSGEFALLDEEKYLNRCARHSVDLNFARGLVKQTQESVAICRRQLFDLLQINTIPGEKVEIYSEFVGHINFNLGPYTRKLELNSDGILETKFPRNDDKMKIEIFRV